MVVISQADALQVQEIKNVLSQTWIDTYSHFLSQNTIRKVTEEWHDPQRLAAQIVNPRVYFAIAQDTTDYRILGLMTAGRLNEDTITISRLYVLPQFQRKGIGQKLLNETIRAFPEAKKLHLKVESENEKGVKFYQKQGFKEVGRTEDTVAGETLHAIEMEKWLP